MDPFNTHHNSNSFEDFNPFEEFDQSSDASFGQHSNTYFQGGQSSYNPFGQGSNPNNQFGQSSSDAFGNSSNAYNDAGNSSNAYNVFANSSTVNAYNAFGNAYNAFGNSSTVSAYNAFENAWNGIPEEDEEESEENLLEWQAVCTAAAYTLVYYYNTFIHKEPCRTSIRTGNKLINEILEGNETRCYQDFRMNKFAFKSLCHNLVQTYGLVPTRGMTAYEEVGIFLMTVAHGTGNRLMQEMFNHSGETISRHFHSVLKAICRMAKDIIIPASNYNTGAGYHKPQHGQYYPHFKNAIGAIDGTHIKCRIHESERTPYFGRKGYATQNILAVCDFNMCFTFAWAGWEGGAHDSRILTEAKSRRELNFPHPTGNKFYLVDAGYPHKKGYMAPYKGSRIRYHIQDFRRSNGTARAPRNAKERYNHLHSSCRMDIERTFGVWKARFAILANMPAYSIDTQTDIVLATMTVHNYIRKLNTEDSAFQAAESETYVPQNSTTTTNNRDGNTETEGDIDNVWNAKRDEIAAHIT